MKYLFLVIGFFFCSIPAFSQGKSYVVLMKESFEAPVRKSRMENEDRENQEKANKGNRDKKLKKIEDFAKGKRINVKKEKQFTDAGVGFVADLDQSQVEDLRRDPSVEGVYEDFTMQTRARMQSRARMQGDPGTPEDLYNKQLKASCAVSIMGGPQTFNGRKSAIWIVDSGVDAQHIDLNVIKNKKLAASFVDNDLNPFVDFAGHGTHCAGLAAGMGNGNPGVTGMSAGAIIIPVKVLDRNGVGSWSNLVLALDHIEKYGQKGDVVLMSLGDYGIANCANSNPFLSQVIADLSQKGLFVVMSAGNDSGNSSQNLPGCIDGPNVFTVGSYDFNCEGLTKISTTGNLGAPSIDWLAPGENVFSTYPGNRYAIMSGTSMSAALVAGLIHSKGGAPSVIKRESFNGITYPVAGR